MQMTSFIEQSLHLVTIYDILQNDINTLPNWVTRNILTLNPSKCKYLVISKLRKNFVRAPVLTLNKVLEKVSSFKYLGVNISDDLTSGPLTLM